MTVSLQSEWIGKRSFHLIGMDARGKVIMRQQLSRGRLERHMANLQPCLVGVEAYAGAHHIKRDMQYLLDNLPKGIVVDVRSSWPIVLKNVDLLSDADRRAWLPKALNSFVNVLRPRLRKWYEETCA